MGSAKRANVREWRMVSGVFTIAPFAPIWLRVPVLSLPQRDQIFLSKGPGCVPRVVLFWASQDHGRKSDNFLTFP